MNARAADQPLAQAGAASPIVQPGSAMRADAGKQAHRRSRLQGRKALVSIKRADLFEPRFWDGLGVSPDRGAHGQLGVALNRQSEGRQRGVLFMQAPGSMPAPQVGTTRAPASGQVEGGMGGAAQPQPPGQAPQPVVNPSLPSGAALPFVFAGRMIDKSEVTLFLLGNSRPIIAKVNDVIDGTYRVDKIDNGSAVLTYLPTHTQQTVVFNSTAIGASSLSSPAERATDANPPGRAETVQQAVDTNSRNVAAEAKSR